MTREKNLKFSMKYLIITLWCRVCCYILHAQSQFLTALFVILQQLPSRTVGTRTVDLVLYCQECKLQITANKRRLYSSATLNGNLLQSMHQENAALADFLHPIPDGTQQRCFVLAACFRVFPRIIHTVSSLVICTLQS